MPAGRPRLPVVSCRAGAGAEPVCDRLKALPRRLKETEE